MERRSFRQWGQLMVGGTLAALAIPVCWASLARGMGRPAEGVAWGLALAATAYVVFLRPCVVLDEGGVRLRNIVRDIDIPWAAVTGAASAWSLVIETADGSHSSWAISGTASPGRDALARRGRPAAQPAQRGSVAKVDAAAVAAGLTPPSTGVSAPALAALVERERARALSTAPVAPGEHPEGWGAGRARARVAWPSVALLLLALAAVLLTRLG